MSRVPADLLEEAFDLNMQLEEMRMARKMGDTDPELQSSLEQAKKKFDGLLDDVDRDLRAQWKVWDAGDENVRQESQKKMVALLDRRRYINNLVRDVTETVTFLCRSCKAGLQPLRENSHGRRTRSWNRPGNNEFPGRIYGG